jgi:hypothetical protein
MRRTLADGREKRAVAQAWPKRGPRLGGEAEEVLRSRAAASLSDLSAGMDGF